MAASAASASALRPERWQRYPMLPPPAVRREPLDARSRAMCLQCGECPPEVLFLPCCHMIWCRSCCKRHDDNHTIRRCPLCRLKRNVPFAMLDVQPRTRTPLLSASATDVDGGAGDQGRVSCMLCCDEIAAAHAKRVRRIMRRRRCSKQSALRYVDRHDERRRRRPPLPNEARVLLFPCLCRIMCRECEHKRHQTESQYDATHCIQCGARIERSVEVRYRT